MPLFLPVRMNIFALFLFSEYKCDFFLYPSSSSYKKCNHLGQFRIILLIFAPIFAVTLTVFGIKSASSGLFSG